MAENDFDYLTENAISGQDKGVLKNLSTMGEKLKELQCTMLAAQAEAERAKRNLNIMLMLLFHRKCSVQVLILLVFHLVVV